MNDVEQECIILNSAWQMIDDMVNWAMFVKHDRTEPTNMMFQTHQHSRLFVILLGDFLSGIIPFKRRAPMGLKASPPRARPSDLTFLYYLRQVYAKPHLGDQVDGLRICTEAFATWLETEFIAEGVNLHAIDVVADLRISRYRYIKMCGDIAKHNWARLARNVVHIRRLLEESGHPVSEEDGYLAIDNFFEWFHDHIFDYHSSLIAEFLNNIRWAMFDYLRSEHARSWHLTEKASPSFPIYAYKYPLGCSAPLARAMYWDLMNRVRSEPWMHRFIAHDAFKSRY
jgi:hypothetical protein